MAQRRWANTAVDHIDVCEAAIWQLDELIRSAWTYWPAPTARGSSHDFLARLRQAHLRFSVGYPVDVHVRNALRALDDDAWTVDTGDAPDGEPRDGAHVAEEAAGRRP